MKIEIKGFIYHKAAEKYRDCFDRLGVNNVANKFAVSDGVSKSFMPGIWAELLIEYFLNIDEHSNLNSVLSYRIIQKEWEKRVEDIVNKPNQKYYIRNLYHQGRSAAATFVGLHFVKENKRLKWRAMALGDSFLFFVPESITNIDEDFDKITYLSSKSDFEFDNFPDFFDSRNINNKGRIKIKSNFLQSGTFYLLTDALSEWFVTQKQKAIQVISTWNTQLDFENSINELRKSILNNDDSTMLKITVKDDGVDEFNYVKTNITNIEDLLCEEARNESYSNRRDENIPAQEYTNPNSDVQLESRENGNSENYINTNFSPDKLINEHNRKKQIDNQKQEDRYRYSSWERNVSRFWNYWDEWRHGHARYDYDERISQNKQRDTNKELNNKKRPPKIESGKDRKNKMIVKKDIAKSTKERNQEDDISSITDKF